MMVKQQKVSATAIVLIIFLQFKAKEFISCILEKYKLSTNLNSVLNSFHDLKFPEP